MTDQECMECGLSAAWDAAGDAAAERTVDGWKNGVTSFHRK